MTLIRSILAFSSEARFYGTGRNPGFAANQEVGLSRMFSKFLKDESAATAIEYGLIAAGIALAIIAAVNGLGTTLNDKFTSINTSLK
jgi:pilus assembly protein Flp/PilA